MYCYPNLRSFESCSAGFYQTACGNWRRKWFCPGSCCFLPPVCFSQSWVLEIQGEACSLESNIEGAYCFPTASTNLFLSCFILTLEMFITLWNVGNYWFALICVFIVSDKLKHWNEEDKSKGKGSELTKTATA